MNPTTDYAARDIARESYVAWIDNCCRKLADRPTRPCPPVESEPARRKTSRTDALNTL